MVSKPYPYTLKDGTVRYYVKYRRPDHTQGTKRGFTRKKDAQDWAARMQVSLNDNDYVDPSSGKIRVSTLAPVFLEGKSGVGKDTNPRDLESAWRVHVQPKWGNRTIASIRRSEIQSWVSRMSSGDPAHGVKGKSASVVLRAYGVLKNILELAVGDGLIRKTPCTDINLPKKVRKPHTYLNEEQVLSLADASGEHDVLILVLGFCGLRMGEVRGLKVKCVDFDAGRLSIEESVTRVKGKYVVSVPKTWERRTVPVPGYVLEKLREQGDGKNGDGLVFPGKAGGCYLREVQRTGHNWYARAIAKSGVPSLTCHDLRHTAASIAVSSGANVKAVQRMLGHRSAAMTLDVYADLFDSDLNLVADKINERILSVRTL